MNAPTFAAPRNGGLTTLDGDLIARLYDHTMDDDDPTLMHEAAYEIARLRAVLAMCGCKTVLVTARDLIDENLAWEVL